MLKEIYFKSKPLIKRYYNILALPAFLLMMLNAVTVAIIEYAGYENVWNKINTLFKGLLLFIYFIVKIVLIPLVSAVLFKVVVAIQDEKGYNIRSGINNFLNFENIKKIFLINFIPTVVNLFAYSSSIDILNVFNFRLAAGEFSIIFKLISLLVSYKFMACNYYFAMKQSSVKDTIAFSFKAMKWKKLLSVIKLSIIFLPWIALDCIIYFILPIIASALSGNYMSQTVYTVLGEYTIPLVSYSLSNVLNCFWFGLGFYVYPYAFVVSTVFLKEICDSYNT